MAVDLAVAMDLLAEFKPVAEAVVQAAVMAPQVPDQQLVQVLFNKAMAAVLVEQAVTVVAAAVVLRQLAQMCRHQVEQQVEPVVQIQ
jgi:hypothetical protein